MSILRLFQREFTHVWISNFFYTFLHQNSRLNSGGSRPSDKRGGSHPDPEIRGGPVSKNNLLPLWASFWSKNKGGRALWALTWDQALLFFFCFFGSRGEKNSAWYIYLTSSQPPPKVHNLTSTWPVMLLANKHIWESNFGTNNVSFEINFREKKIFKYVHVQMALPKKKMYVLFLWWNTASWSCLTFI